MCVIINFNLNFFNDYNFVGVVSVLIIIVVVFIVVLLLCISERFLYYKWVVRELKNINVVLKI